MKKLNMASVNNSNRALENKSQYKEAGLRKIYRIVLVSLPSISRLFPVCFPSISQLCNIRLPLNCRPSNVVQPYCCRNADVSGSSNKKNYNRSFCELPVHKRILESNQFNNLSPPHKHSANKISDIKLIKFFNNKL